MYSAWIIFIAIPTVSQNVILNIFFMQEGGLKMAKVPRIPKATVRSWTNFLEPKKMKVKVYTLKKIFLVLIFYVYFS